MDKSLKIIQKKYIKKKDLVDSHLTLEFNGIDVSILNAIRRICYDDIPTYSFCDESIYIEENSSRFDNDYMRMRISQFTIPNIKNNLEMYHPGKKLINHYYSSNLYINLARVESFGLTFIEALASGLPILSFNTKGINEILHNNKNGFFLKNLDSFVNKILIIQKSPTKYYKLVKSSHDSVKKYDLDKNIFKIDNMYKKFINSRD